jgi:hypothetical protein
MIDLLFGMSFLIFPFMVTYLLYCANVEIIKLNISNFLLLNLFVFSYFGILPLFYKLDSYRVEMGVTSSETLFTLYLFAMLAISFYALGLMLASRVKVTTDKKLPVFIENDKLIFFIMACSLPLFAATIYSYVSSLKSVALFIALQLVSGDSVLSRSDMSNGFDGYHWFKLINQDVLIFMLLWSYAKTFSNSSFNYIFYILLLMATFSVILTTEKAPFIWLIASLFAVKVFIKNDRMPPLKSLLIFGSFSLLVMTAFYASFMNMGFDRLGDAFFSIFSRLFAGSIQPAYHYLDYFSVNNYLLGASFPNPGGLLPFNNFYLTQEIMDFVKPSNALLGIKGTMPTVFWGEAYANFGTLGVMFISFFIAFSLKCVDNYFDGRNLSSVGLALYVWIIFHFKDLSVTGFSQYLVDNYLVLIFIIYTIMRFLIFRKVNESSPLNAY